MIYPVTPAPEFFSRRSPSHARHLPAASKFSQIVANLFLPPVPFTGRHLIIGDSKDRHYLTSLPLTPPPQSNPLLSLFPSATPHVPPFYALTLFEWVRPRSRHSLLLRVYLLYSELVLSSILSHFLTSPNTSINQARQFHLDCIGMSEHDVSPKSTVSKHFREVKKLRHRRTLRRRNRRARPLPPENNGMRRHTSHGQAKGPRDGLCCPLARGSTRHHRSRKVTNTKPSHYSWSPAELDVNRRNNYELKFHHSCPFRH